MENTKCSDQQDLADEQAERFLKMKTRLMWHLCHELIDPPLPKLENLKFSPEDTEEEKQEKQIEYERKRDERDVIKMKREPELLRKFDKYFRCSPYTYSCYILISYIIDFKCILTEL